MVVATVPAVVVTSPVRAGNLVAGTVPESKFEALRLVKLAPEPKGFPFESK
jgi:hypothetical protein